MGTRKDILGPSLGHDLDDERERSLDGSVSRHPAGEPGSRPHPAPLALVEVDLVQIEQEAGLDNRPPSDNVVRFPLRQLLDSSQA